MMINKVVTDEDITDDTRNETRCAEIFIELLLGNFRDSAD